jgi:zinc protease
MDPEPCLTWLPNGLTIHLKELHTAPIISHWVWYRVGSRYEVPGFTGISHWVEHMQFKGTPRFPTRQLDKAISRTGGNWNAFTHLDWTTYYETLPADQYALALNLERDRMINSLFDPAEVEAERTVILSELDGNENEPRHRLGQAVRKAAFDIHPYRNEVIGTKEDLQSITRDDLYRHYQHYYQPANAIIAIAGDFDTQEMLAQVAERYQDLPGSVVEPVAIQTEPPLTGERRAEITGPGGTTYLQVVYRAPAAREADFITFSLLDSLLSGATSLNMFGGGGTTNKTSRLYKTMVEKELVVSVRGGVQATIDPNTYEIACTLRPERSPDQVLQALDDQIKRLQDELVSDEEIRRAAKQARALFAYGNENITNQAFWLGYAEMFANYGWFTGYLDRLAQVTPAEIQRIAQVYLQPQHRVVGLYLPGGSAEGEHD